MSFKEESEPSDPGLPAERATAVKAAVKPYALKKFGGVLFCLVCFGGLDGFGFYTYTHQNKYRSCANMLLTKICVSRDSRAELSNPKTQKNTQTGL